MRETWVATIQSGTCARPAISFLVFSTVILSCCASAPIKKPDFPAQSAGKVEHESRAVTGGDAIQVSYFMNYKQETEKYKIGVGDVLRIDVADHLELVKDEVTVMPDGRITASLVGPIPVSGKTVEEVSRELASLYNSAHLNNANVVITIVRGQQRLRQFLQSLGLDRGLNKIELRAYDERFLHLPLIPPVALGRPLMEIRQDICDAYRREFGDQLEVTVNFAGRNAPNAYVMGEVKKPGNVELIDSSTLLSVIAAAGGFADTANIREVLVVRFRGDGTYDYWAIDMEGADPPTKLTSGFKLKGNDVVYVSKSTIAKANLFVEQYIRKMLPVDVGFGAYVPME